MAGYVACLLRFYLLSAVAFSSKSSFSKTNGNTIRVSNCLDSDQDGHIVGQDLDLNC